MLRYVDLNSDIGESYGAYTIGIDDEVLKYISSANIACGWHAGDPVIMRKTVETAMRLSVSVGAHNGLPDLQGFGRRNMVLSENEARQFTIYQLGALEGFVRAAGGKMQHVKPHGALYNMAVKDIKLASAIIEGVYEFDKDLIILGPAGSELHIAAKEKGMRFANEVFADRAYNPDGTLVPRNLPNSMIHDKNQAISRVVRMVSEGKVTAVNGQDIDIQVDSVCVHGDNPEAVEFVKSIRKALLDLKIEIKPLMEFIR